ncbi:hypothetical protein ACQR16_32755 [Bradyrhizobium oligotrophicum]|uniref:hypothetical protein n=1 Tax=Bradyrhizobium oligotrophicum TaxID=44255 RepID=UPI003EC08FC2
MDVLNLIAGWRINSSIHYRKYRFLWEPVDEKEKKISPKLTRATTSFEFRSCGETSAGPPAAQISPSVGRTTPPLPTAALNRDRGHCGKSATDTKTHNAVLNH